MGIFIVEIILKWSGVIKNVYKRNSFVAVFLPVFENPGLVLEQVIQWRRTTKYLNRSVVGTRTNKL